MNVSSISDLATAIGLKSPPPVPIRRRRSSISKRITNKFKNHLLDRRIDAAKRAFSYERRGGCDVSYCNCTLYVGLGEDLDLKGPCRSCNHDHSHHWEVQVEDTGDIMGGVSGDEADCDENLWETETSLMQEDEIHKNHSQLDWYFVWHIAGIEEDTILRVVLSVQRNFRQWRWKRLLERIQLSSGISSSATSQNEDAYESEETDESVFLSSLDIEETETVGSEGRVMEEMDSEKSQTDDDTMDYAESDFEPPETPMNDKKDEYGFSDTSSSISQKHFLQSRRTSLPNFIPENLLDKSKQKAPSALILTPRRIAAAPRRSSLPTLKKINRSNNIKSAMKRKKKRRKRKKKQRAQNYSLDIFNLARRGNEKDVLSLLDIRPTRIPIDASDFSSFGHHRTLLIIAAAHSMNGLMWELIKRHANVNHVDSLGRTAIFYAVRNGNTKGTEILLGHGADVASTVDKKGMTIMSYAKKEIQAGHQEVKKTLALVMLALKKHGGILRKYLYTYNLEQQSQVKRNFLDFGITFNDYTISKHIETNGRADEEKKAIYLFDKQGPADAEIWGETVTGVCFEGHGEVYAGTFRTSNFSRKTGVLYDKMNSFVYEGDFNGFNKRHGKGRGIVYTRQGQGYYIGDFVDNLPHGDGSMRLQGWSTSPSYIGQYNRGIREGRGTCYKRDGRLLYRGDMRNDGCNGHGTLFHYEYSGIEGTYTGDIIGSMPYGKGTFTNANGVKIYEGDHLDGKRQGKGHMYFPDQTSYRGDIEDGDCTGKGTYFLSDQTPITGAFKDAILIDPLEGEGGWRRYPLLNYGLSGATRKHNEWFATAASGDEIKLQSMAEEEGFKDMIDLKMPRVLGGMTALHVSMRFGREECATYLVYRGNCDLTPLDTFGRTPMQVGREESGATITKQRQKDSIMVLRNAIEYRQSKQRTTDEKIWKAREAKERAEDIKRRMAYLV
jgi:hypothetical protein